MQEKPKIVFVINEYSFFLSHRKNLVLEISKHFEVVIITDLTGYFDHESLQDSPYKILHLERRKSSGNIIKVFKFCRRLIFLINQSGGEVVFFVSLENCMLGSLVRRFIKIKKYFLIVTGLETIFDQSSLRKICISKLFKFFLKFSVNRNDADFIFQNYQDQKELSKNLNITIENFHIIRGNGIDIDRFKFKQRFLNANKNKIKILFASRLLHSKGVMKIFDTANNLVNTNNRLEFSIAGKYDPKNALSISKNDFLLLNESKNINFLGEVPNNKIQDLYLKNDIFILPSIREGIPSAALEAASTGMPLILSNVAGCKECISSIEKNGVLFELCLSDSLEQEILKLSRNMENLFNYSLNSRKHIEKHFSTQKISEKYLKIIDEIG